MREDVTQSVPPALCRVGGVLGVCTWIVDRRGQPSPVSLPLPSSCQSLVEPRAYLSDVVTSTPVGDGGTARSAAPTGPPSGVTNRLGIAEMALKKFLADRPWDFPAVAGR